MHLQAPSYFDACKADTFSGLSEASIQILSLSASPVINASISIPQGREPGHYGRNVSGLNFCNVSISYTHPGKYDDITTEVLLPLEGWNNNFQGSAGGGYHAGFVTEALYGAISDGFVVATTDAGHTLKNGGSPPSWVLNADGSFNDTIWLDYAYVATGDVGLIGKAVTRSFFGKPPHFSYFTGCSGGGRQALEVAQRYPDTYDGILAIAPAIHLPTFLMNMLYPNVVYNDLQEWPFPCELDALRAAAIAACDGQDGVLDGIISTPESCRFNPFDHVGTYVNCSGQTRSISLAAAKGAQAAWGGARGLDGRQLWFGYNFDAPLTSPNSPAGTLCDKVTGRCQGAPWSTAVEWLQYLVLRDPGFNFSTVDRKNYEHFLELSQLRLNPSVATDKPDLESFRRHGGKVLLWHGLADQIIVTNGSREYYERVNLHNRNATEFFRYFEAPGVQHCSGGVGPYPGDALQALRKWVEDDEAPEVLAAASESAADGSVFKRNLCLYPQRARYDGTGDIHSSSSYTCTS